MYDPAREFFRSPGTILMLTKLLSKPFSAALPLSKLSLPMEMTSFSEKFPSTLFLVGLILS